MSKIIIPTPLRKFTGSTATVNVEGSTVEQAIQNLANTFPDLKQHLFDFKMYASIGANPFNAECLLFVLNHPSM